MRGARPQLVLIRGGLDGFKVLANGNGVNLASVTGALAEGASKVRLSSRVDNDTYYLDGTFSEGFAVIVR